MNSIRSRLLSITLIVITVLSITSLGIYITHMVIVEKYKAISDNLIIEYRMMAATSDLINAYNEEYRNPNEKSVQTVKDIKNEISSLTNQLDTRIVNKDSLVVYVGFKNVVADVINQIDTGVISINKGNSSDASVYYDNANLKYAFVKDDGTQLIFNELQYANTLQIQINTLYQVSTAVGGVLILIITLGSILYMVSFSKEIVRPIQRLEKIAQQIAHGDMNIAVDKELLERKDETGSLAISFNTMVSNLGNNITKLKNSNSQLEEAKNAMVNILEDEKKLEEALKIEKAGVEKKVVERTKDLMAAKEKISEGWLQIQKEKAKLSASIENMPLGFIMTDILGNLLVTNSNAQRILGGKNSQEVYFRLKEILKGKIDVDDYLKSCNEKTVIANFPEIALSDGRFLKTVLSPIITSEENVNKCIGIVILVEDITEAKVLERSKDEFFSIASHELRTPLTAIKGNTSLIEQYYSEKLKDPELKDMIADIHESSSRLIDIVNDFLDVSRLEQGKIEFKKQPIDIAKLIEEVIKEFQVSGSQRKIALEYKKDVKNPPLAFADIDKTKQVLINLIGNSLKFTENGGIAISTQMVPGYVKILVSDSGRGISVENQKLLFRKFQQAGSSLLTRDTTKGTGLGLYISKLIVSGMGGDIKLESSTEGKGSVFSFTLPIATKEQENGSAVKSTVKLDTATGLTKKVN